MIRNHRTPEGTELGQHLARFCDEAEPRARLIAPDLPPRCHSCALRPGRHVANGSPTTLMDVIKCLVEGKPFFCHEPDREGELCMGWVMLTLANPPGEDRRQVPWDFSDKSSTETNSTASSR